MSNHIGLSVCPCGEPIMGKLTGNVKKCDEHPNELCWLWEWEENTICPACGKIQSYLHQPPGGKAGQKQYAETAKYNNCA